jgi:hypothetical protein
MRIHIDQYRKDGTLHLRLFVHDAPHRRLIDEYREILVDYRKHLLDAAKVSNIDIPIMEHVEIDVTFVNPTSPDLGNLYLALENGLDGIIVIDDSRIQKQTSSKMYVGGVEERTPVKLQLIG